MIDNAQRITIWSQLNICLLFSNRYEQVACFGNASFTECLHSLFGLLCVRLSIHSHYVCVLFYHVSECACVGRAALSSVALTIEASSKTLLVGLLYGALTQQEHPDLERLSAGSR